MYQKSHFLHVERKQLFFTYRCSNCTWVRLPVTWPKRTTASWAPRPRAILEPTSSSSLETLSCSRLDESRQPHILKRWICANNLLDLFLFVKAFDEGIVKLFFCSELCLVQFCMQGQKKCLPNISIGIVVILHFKHCQLYIQKSRISKILIGDRT